MMTWRDLYQSVLIGVIIAVFGIGIATLVIAITEVVAVP